MHRTDNDREYVRPPEEYPAPAAQVTPPPPEFGSGGQDAPSRQKKRKLHWLAAALAAGFLSTVALFGDTANNAPEPWADPTSAAVVAMTTPSSTPNHTPSPSAAPTGKPTPAPTAVAAPAPTPGIQLTFYRTSEVYSGIIQLAVPEKITAVTARLWDRVLRETIWEHPFTNEDMSRGVYALSGFDLAASEFVQTHLDQVRAVNYELDPVLEVIYTVQTEDGERTFTEQAEPAYELWIGVSYDLKDPDKDFRHYFMGETTYPDCFVIRIEEVPYGDLNVTYGEDSDLQPGDVAVTVTVNGESISADACRLERFETVYPEGTLYTYILVMPRPESFPTEGTAEVCVTRRLIHYPDHTTTDIRSVAYGEE